MLEDKAMIIIAVSKYAGAYGNLPGAITSAYRLRIWAEDEGYKVLYLADDVLDKIDVQLVSQEVSRFVNNNFIDRLVVYFAGHGIVRSTGEQFWLLTDAASNSREGINVEAFRRGLLKCNIGNNDFAGQLCIIGDACRNIARDAIDFYGDQILTSTARMNRNIQLDRFLSTGLGDYSFQINEIGNQSAYCLFSEVMLSALRGEVKEAIETENHKFKPVVTNHKLADYLEQEVKNRAAAIQKEMEPDLLTGIRPPYNFYKKLPEPLPDVIASPQDRQVRQAIHMAIRNPQAKNSNDQPEVQERRKQTVLRRKRCFTRKKIQANMLYRRRQVMGATHMAIRDPQAKNSNDQLTRYQERRKQTPLQRTKYKLKNIQISEFSTISDFQPKFVAIPKSAAVKIYQKETFYEIQAIDRYDSPILINQGEQWILIPNYPNVITFISHDLPNDIFVLKTRNLQSNEIWNTYRDFSNLIGSVPLRAADARKFADKIRSWEEEYPHRAVIAGYLYEFSNDYDNIARIAHHMVLNTNKVPFDLALLCADKIWWRKENNRVVAFANLPGVEQLQTTDNEEDRPYYTRYGFEERENVQLWGIAPIFSQGWNFMQTELYLEIPEGIRLIGENINGRSATSLTDKGLKMFLKAFDYQIIETDSN